mmetsp:Transcript_10640/g.12416  ORF Transcript_10640/g.12416 Transcript_10640/m.12416 type:complete len:328 (+) Transcript_10640:261-1244(+)|eukprot:CAMPEP_0197861592 /NCGR_PEP_ID=MMETSP1438-20131217/37760_1 /TAXON_ID=1461541 /ORGANISM="Pterosperma sp., Strain CCMP1384" /LENGTH=327 /DNA_ID=CAMNT_0043478819 /DNA_START=259 /DNA_END=1242 /DNA_ORIENTATION=+
MAPQAPSTPTGSDRSASTPGSTPSRTTPGGTVVKTSHWDPGNAAYKTLMDKKKADAKEQRRKRMSGLLDRLRKNESVVENVAWWSLTTDECAQIFTLGSRCTPLTTLYCDGNGLGSRPSGISVLLLSPQIQLTELTMTENNLGPEALKAIANALRTNQTLLLLDVKNNQISDNGTNYEGLKTLSDCLDAQGGKPGINYNITLSSLDLSGNCLYDYGVNTLQTVIQHNTVLSELHLANNGMTQEAGKFLLECLKTGSENGSILYSMQLLGNDIHLRELSKIQKILDKSAGLRRNWESKVQSRFVKGNMKGKPKSIREKNGTLSSPERK